MARKKANKDSNSEWKPLGGGSAMTFGKDAPKKFTGALFTREVSDGTYGDQTKLGFLPITGNLKKVKPFYVWAPAGLANQVVKVSFGTQLQVVYEGLKKITAKKHKQKGKKAHSFRVFSNGVKSKSSDYSGYKFR